MVSEIEVLVGLPGSGKSTYADKQCGALVYGADRLRGEDEPFDSTTQRGYWAQVQDDVATALEHLNGIRLIIDGTHLEPKWRQWYISEGIRHAGVPVTATFFDTPLHMCIEQQQGRSEYWLVPQDQMVWMNSILVPPTLTEGFQRVRYVTPEYMTEHMTV